MQEVVHAVIIQVDFEVSEHLPQLLNRESAPVSGRVQLTQGVTEKVHCFVLDEVVLHLLVEVLRLLGQGLRLRVQRSN